MVEYALVRVVKPIKEFVGYDDLDVYGPFESGDVARVPRLCGEALRDQNRVEVVDQTARKETANNTE